jgi:L-ascorbate metabolism protein UlaG (beta-lactamase superfamily)
MTKEHGVSITWLGHATVLYRSAKGKVVLGDAWVDQNPACPESAKQLPPIDVMLITHGHSDHIGDAISIAKKLKPDVVSNFEISLYLADRGVGKTTGMNVGGTLSLHGLRVTMVNAVHSSSIREGSTFYPAGEACGYVIEFEDGTRVYHAGDTAVMSDMKLIGEIYQPQVAVLPIGDLFTMSPREASFAARMIGARLIVPVHHSTFPALTGTPAALREQLRDRPDIEVADLKPGQTRNVASGAAVA